MAGSGKRPVLLVQGQPPVSAVLPGLSAENARAALGEAVRAAHSMDLGEYARTVAGTRDPWAAFAGAGVVLADLLTFMKLDDADAERALTIVAGRCMARFTATVDGG